MLAGHQASSPHLRPGAVGVPASMAPMHALFLTLALAGSALAAPVTYKLSQDMTRLTATANGQTVTLIDMEKALPRASFREGREDGFVQGMNIYDLVVRDFDGDGSNDALISYGLGGNCCAPFYAFVTYRPGNVLRISNPFTSWQTPPTETFRGRPVVKVRDEREGTVTRYGFTGGKAVIVDEQPIPELTALAEMRVEIFNPKKPSLTFNVGGDSHKEVMTCSVWDRWNTLRCGIKDGQGRILLEDNLGCDRYGILPSKTRGYHDLVCGLDQVGRWNGRTWVFPGR